jgi:glycosyltransferase involved in cell wall biosynthesis
MKIGVVYLGRRGAGAAIAYEMAHHLANKANIFVVVSNQADNIELWRKSDIPRVETETFDGWLSAFLSIANFSKLCALANHIKAQEPDILLFPMFHLWMPFLQKRLAGIPSIAFVHDPISHPGLIPSIIKVLEDIYLRRADCCVIFSEVFRKDMYLRGVTPQNIEVVPHGELSYYQKLASSSRSAGIANKWVLLFFGRIAPYKGLDVLLRAFSSVQNREDVELLIVGEGDMSPFAAMLKGLKHIHVTNRFIPEEEVANVFKKASIVVLPYTSATQSGVIPVAAAFKLPVIATRVGGIPEQITDGETGILVEPGSVEQLSAAIEGLLNDPDQGARLGNALYTEYVQNRNWSQVSEKILAICSKVLR